MRNSPETVLEFLRTPGSGVLEFFAKMKHFDLQELEISRGHEVCDVIIRLIAGTNPFAVGSWRQIWARDVAFLHFSQTASLRPRSAGKVLRRNLVRQQLRTIVRSKGGGLGKMKKSDISGPNLPPGTNTRSVGSCDQPAEQVRLRKFNAEPGKSGRVLEGVRLVGFWRVWILIGEGLVVGPFFLVPE